MFFTLVKLVLQLLLLLLVLIGKQQQQKRRKRRNNNNKSKKINLKVMLLSMKTKYNEKEKKQPFFRCLALHKVSF